MAHILNFYNDDDKNDLMYYVKGHLYIEYALNDIINKAFTNPKALSRIITNSFANKISLLKAVGRISPQMDTFLTRFNKIRNSISHHIDYVLSYEEIIELGRCARKANVEFTDVNMYNALDGNRAHYEIHDVIEELIGGTFYSLFHLNEDLYPNKEFMKYIGYY